MKNWIILTTLIGFSFLIFIFIYALVKSYAVALLVTVLVFFIIMFT